MPRTHLPELVDCTSPLNAGSVIHYGPLHHHHLQDGFISNIHESLSHSTAVVPGGGGGGER